MTTMRSGPYDTDPDAVTVAARCFTLAEQIGGGPVREALLAMGRDYTERARQTARATADRITREYEVREAPRSTLARWMSDLFDPLPQQPAPARRAAPTTRVSAAMPQQARVAAPMAQGSAQPASRRTSRLYRMHALTRLD
jgi:hypothetical protein